MSQTVTMRLSDDTAEWLKTAARRVGRSVSELGAALFEEARRTSEFAEIEFRTFSGERHACLKGGLRVWKIVFSAQRYDMDAAKTAVHFELPEWKVRAALDYYEAFPKEIDEAVSDAKRETFESVRRQLPRIERQEVTVQEVTATESGAAAESSTT
ncbi:MAG: transcriptional regulator [Proteobacteria bacterium]|nr:MAG: transcriptional regulator [Pseudomonadota bacterium]